MREELKHYSHIVLIDIEPLREISKQNADSFGLEYLELSRTSLNYFHSFIRTPYGDQNFIVLEPVDAVKQDLFLKYVTEKSDNMISAAIHSVSRLL